MSFYADRKRGHEAAAEAALVEKNYARAFFHTAKAAEFGLKLAEQSDGKIAARYVDDAFDLIDLAAQMKKKAETQSSGSVRQVISQREGADDEAPAGSLQLMEKPKVKLDDVAGLGDVKDVLREKVILPLQHPEIYERFRAETGAGVLVYGPPGNGKTYVAKAIAGELDAAFFNVDLSQIKSKYVGETAKNLTRVFEEARRHERAVLFLDECDALLARRGNRKVDSVAQFLALTDGLIKGTNCMLVLAATNKPWVIDEAVIRPGRLGTHIYVGLPDEKARESIVSLNMKGVPMAPDVSAAAVAAKTPGYSGADMAAVCDRAKMAAVRRQITSGRDELVTAADFADALEKVKPSVSAQMIKDLERWRDTKEKPSGADEEDD